MTRSSQRPPFRWRDLATPFTCLAPMEDVTDTVFRRIVASIAPPDVFFTEFTSADGLQSPGRTEVAQRLVYTETERPLVAQVWGAQPENFFRTAGELAEAGFDGIDINMGCPVDKIIKKGCCGALCRDMPLAKEMILATVAGAGGLPVSVKTRLGFERPNTEEWCGFLLSQPIQALIVHGRSVTQQSEGRADWDEIAGVVKVRDRTAPQTVIVGNGDLVDREDLCAYPQRYGVDGVMVGRGIFHDLFIFDRTGTLPHYQELGVTEKLAALRRHVELYEEVWKDDRNVQILKKFVKTYVAGFSGAASVRDSLMHANGYPELYREIDRLERSL